MALPSLQAGTVGDVLTAAIYQVANPTLPYDLTNPAAQTLSMALTDPTGKTTTYPATLVANTVNQIQVITTATMLAVPGQWKVEAVATFTGGGVAKSNVGALLVYSSLV